MSNTPSPQSSDEKKARVQDYFSRTAASYVTSISHRMGGDLKRLIELGEWNAQQLAIDIATGGGHTARAIAPHVAQVMVTDLTPAMLDTARAFLQSEGINNAQFQIADAENLPFAAESFDRATCRIAPHHFPNVARSIQEIARVLKPGGIFLLIDNIAPKDPALDSFDNTIEKLRDPSHERSYTKEEWQAFFAQAGLQIAHVEIFRRTHNFDDWTLRSQMLIADKEALERYILDSAPRIRQYFDVVTREDGHLASFATDSILVKGRKHSS
ncbi:MAG: class I SAM-dependent methyltransferase [Ktedonobacteraceae bacterium]